MIVSAVIAEYNPFHDGHLWQLQQIRAKQGKKSGLLVVLSGHFCQRGEPALLDKWQRSQMAIDAGADLVIELPTVFSFQSAERFAQGAVKLISATGIAQNVFFGTETSDLTQLEKIASFLSKENPAYQKELKLGLDSGISFPAARALALETLIPETTPKELLSKSNNILALEYLKAFFQLPLEKQTFKLASIQRQGQDYNSYALEETNNQNFASATAIRTTIFKHLFYENAITPALSEKLLNHLPHHTLAQMLFFFHQKKGPLFLHDFFPQLNLLLQSLDASEISLFAYMQEGLGERLKSWNHKLNRLSLQELSAIIQTALPDVAPLLEHLQQDLKHPNLRNVLLCTALIAKTKTRRLPQTRIQRALCALLLNIKQTDAALMHADPQYLRILGFNRQGQHMLKLMHKYASLPVITRASDALHYSNQPLLTKQFQKDILATDLWHNALNLPSALDFDTQVSIR